MVSNAPIAFPPIHLIRGVIFDLDGTLLDTETESTHAINLALAHHGAAITPDIKRAIIGMRSSEWSSYVITTLGLDGKMDPLDLVRQWEENLSARMSGVALMPGASDALAFFRKYGIPMAIATSSSPASVAVKRAAHPDVLPLHNPELQSTFCNPRSLQIFSGMAHVLTSADVSNGKPSPDIFLAAARRLGADASACIVFEDSPHGVTAGVPPSTAFYLLLFFTHRFRSLRSWYGVCCNTLPCPLRFSLCFRLPLPHIPLPPGCHTGHP
jgi:beta-phosphoglucomutase-like phosphatase (HAD superfamily)